ncbi:MAG: RluA family pseudouridine synthase [bacterium]|jgi:23S rRNA pseudouridine1911/1915/1917 synthase
MSSIQNYSRVIEFTYPTGGEPVRLDKYIGQTSSFALTRSKVQKLIEAGLVTVDDKPAAHYQLLSGGEKVVILVPEESPSFLVPEEISLDIIYEDDYLLVVNKPAGMTVHPGAGQKSGTLANALLNYVGNLSKLSGGDRPGIVHRLDKDTSGLVLVAKDDRTHLALQKLFQARKITKRYTALICGHLKETIGQIELPISRSRKDRQKMAVSPGKGRFALTEYRLTRRYRLYDLLDIRIHTGRTHQIRVHFSHLGHPVFGDPDYGGRNKWHKSIFSGDRQVAAQALAMMPRQALHARLLEFIHPVSDTPLTFECPLPGDFMRLLDFLDTDS